MTSNVIFLRLTRILSVEQTDLVAAFMSKAAGISYPLAVEPKKPRTERQI